MAEQLQLLSAGRALCSALCTSDHGRTSPGGSESAQSSAAAAVPHQVSVSVRWKSDSSLNISFKSVGSPGLDIWTDLLSLSLPGSYSRLKPGLHHLQHHHHYEDHQEENTYGNWIDTMTTICDHISSDSQVHVHSSGVLFTLSQDSEGRENRQHTEREIWEQTTENSYHHQATVRLAVSYFVCVFSQCSSLSSTNRVLFLCRHFLMKLLWWFIRWNESAASTSTTPTLPSIKNNCSNNWRTEMFVHKDVQQRQSVSSARLITLNKYLYSALSHLKMYIKNIFLQRVCVKGASIMGCQKILDSHVNRLTAMMLMVTLS